MQTHRRKLAALATVLAAGSVAVGSGASFTSASANPANTFTAGTLTHTNSAADAAVLTAGNLKPGDSASGEVTITNTGTLPGSFTLSRGTTSGELLPKLSVVITDVTNDAVVYSGLVADMPAKPLAGQFSAKGGARTFRFVTTLAQDADNSFQGKTASVVYKWDEVQ